MRHERTRSPPVLRKIMAASAFNARIAALSSQYPLRHILRKNAARSREGSFYERRMNFLASVLFACKCSTWHDAYHSSKCNSVCRCPEIITAAFSLIYFAASYMINYMHPGACRCDPLLRAREFRNVYVKALCVINRAGSMTSDIFAVL